jgi:Ca2+:H+ antiporter
MPGRREPRRTGPATSTRLSRSDRWLLGGAAAGAAASGVLHGVAAPPVATFVVSGIALAGLAGAVGRAVDQLGDRLGAGATGVLQSALGNLPELLVGVFALRAGLYRVVETAIVGSILGNILLVLGFAFLVGGLRHRVQRFSAARARTASTLMLIAVAGLLVPSLAAYVGSPAARHEGTLSVLTAVVLLAVFVASVPASLRRGEQSPPSGAAAGEPPRQPAGLTGAAVRWSLAVALAALVAAGLLSGAVSDWFVAALRPSLSTLHISQSFAGLVIVAIAGNAVEHAVGVSLAARNHADYAVSVILNSPVQIALVLAPLLVLVSYGLGRAPFTLVFGPLPVTTLAASVVVVAFVTSDGKSDWVEGAALIGLYILIAASFWWG